MPAIPFSIPPGNAALDPSLWDRLSTWAAENKVVIYTVAGVAVAVTGAGVVYYLNRGHYLSRGPASQRDLSSTDTPQKLSKKERKKRKEAEKKAADAEKAKAAAAAAAAAAHDSSSQPAAAGGPQPKAAEVAPEEDLPEITDAALLAMTLDERKATALKIKEYGNRAYGARDFKRAIELYTQAIRCRQDPVYYSNRAACYNALYEWDKVVDDTTAALNLDPEYVKALNRRATAYEHLGRYSESLLDYTASCIIDGFKNESSAQAVERLLKKFAETKAKEMMETRPARLPSPTFVSNFLQSFRARPRPAALDDAAELRDDSGPGQLRLGLQALDKKTAAGYDEAAAAFDEALELGELGDLEALAYNLRGTFECLRGKLEQALADLDKSIELDPTMSQSYIKRASLNLELGAPDKATEDFATALEHSPTDPDVYYHRAQLHFLRGEYAEATKDYQKSIDLDRDFIYSHIQLGVTQYKTGSIASSMATFRRCIKNFPQSPDGYNYYGELLRDQSRFQDAMENFEKAIELEKQTNVANMNVLPLINKSVTLLNWKQDFTEAEIVCKAALIIDPECDIAVATMAQLLLQQGKVTEALKYFERAADLARTEDELVNALSYAEATRTQIQVQEKYPALAAKLQGMGGVLR